MLEEKSYGMYYSLQRKYLREQEDLHGAQVRMIQANYRIYQAKKRVNAVRGQKADELENAQMNYAACLIQNQSRSRNAKKELMRRKDAKLDKVRMCEERSDELRRRVSWMSAAYVTLLYLTPHHF